MLTGMLDNNACIELRCMGGRVSPLRVTIVGTNGFFDIDFKDPFFAFKNTLDAFKFSKYRRNERLLTNFKIDSSFVFSCP